MTQYNTLNVQLPNLQLNNLKSAIKNGTEVTLNLPSNLIGSSNGETSFSHKLLLTNAQVSKIRKAFANVSSGNIKFSKTELSKMIQSRGLIGLEYGIGPIKGLLSMPKTINNKIENLLEVKEESYDTIKTVDNSIKSRQNVFGITLTDNEIKDTIKVIRSLEILY